MRGLTVVTILIVGFAALLFQSLRDQIQLDIERAERFRQSPMWMPLRLRTPSLPGFRPGIGGPVFLDAHASGADDHSRYV